jgi:hypothetical protein
MTIIKAILVACGVLTMLIAPSGACAEALNLEQLNKAVDDYQASQERKPDIVIPSPDKAPTEITTDSIRGDEGAAALKNLKEERSLRIQQDILDQLPQ